LNQQNVTLAKIRILTFSVEYFIVDLSSCSFRCSAEDGKEKIQIQGMQTIRNEVYGVYAETTKRAAISN